MTFYDKPWEDDSEYMELIADLLVKPEVQKLDEYVHHHHTTRLIHSLNVSYQSFRIARKFGWKKREVARAGLLHDLFYYDWRETKFEEGSHAYVHPRIAYRNALKLTELSELERDIIIKHMWGATIAPPKYKESFVVTFVDKYCAVKERYIPLANKWREFRGTSKKIGIDS
ncbi:HD domain-containing protein [Streptococcaceae bacterium ESL0687]|nr:HD domain-containing protein [Streptococcaceae bacterium ESL0687]